MPCSLRCQQRIARFRGTDSKQTRVRVTISHSHHVTHPLASMPSPSQQRMTIRTNPSCAARAADQPPNHHQNLNVARSASNEQPLSPLTSAPDTPRRNPRSTAAAAARSHSIGRPPTADRSPKHKPNRPDRTRPRASSTPPSQTTTPKKQPKQNPKTCPPSAPSPPP